MPVKIAYYVQNMTKKEKDSRKVILTIISQFNNRDIKEFANKYRSCFNESDVRMVASLIYSIPIKALKRSMEQLIEDTSL